MFVYIYMNFPVIDPDPAKVLPVFKSCGTRSAGDQQRVPLQWRDQFFPQFRATWSCYC